MLLAEIEARLGARAQPPLREVAGAANLAALMAGRREKARAGAAFVVPESDRAGPNRLVNDVRQSVTRHVGIVIAAGRAGDGRGSRALADVEGLRLAVRAALLGWQPGAAGSALSYVRGSLVGMGDGLVWWQDTFATDLLIDAV